MATSDSFANYILDCIDNKKTSVRKMFGEYAFYFDKKVMGLICDETLFLKITENSKKIISEYEKENSLKVKIGHAYKGAKESFVIGEEILENRKLLEKLIFGIWEDVPLKKK